MKRILMRAAKSPLEDLSVEEILHYDKMGTNPGNMLFAHSVCRAVMTDDDTQIDAIETYNVEFTDEMVKEYNKKYDLFIIPLANAFRYQFISELDNITNLVKRLKIPCIVIGCGIQGEKTKKDLTSMNEAVKRFMNAVLEKSSCIGIRGEYTAEFLEKLGYVRDKDFMVIGCPSMFLYGENLPVPNKIPFDEIERVSITARFVLWWSTHNLFRVTAESIKDSYFLPQTTYELRLLWLGLNSETYPSGYASMFAADAPEFYPIGREHDIIKNGRAIGFTNVYSWLEFLKTRQFALGSRIHGTIAPILAGVPAFVIVPDLRVRELVEYHNIPHISMEYISEHPQTTARELYEKTDFNQILDGHKERFEKYVEFFERNNVDNIFSRKITGEAPFDRATAHFNRNGVITSFWSASPEEQERRINSYAQFLMNESKKETEKIKDKYEKRERSIKFIVNRLLYLIKIRLFGEKK